jgi:hypothetical protein
MKTLMIVFLFAIAIPCNMHAEDKCITHAITIPKMRLVPNMEFIWLCERFEQYDCITEICNALINDEEVHLRDKTWYIYWRAKMYARQNDHEAYEKDMELLRHYYFSDLNCTFEIENGLHVYFKE